ncbi:hypothetical protein Z043_118121, partial [Scleropages formosus]
YEKYNTIRADPALCFLDRVGRPDEKAIAAEQRANDFIDGLKEGCEIVMCDLELVRSLHRDVDDPEYKPAPALLKDDMEDDASSSGDLVITDAAGEGGAVSEGNSVYWPPPSALTARLRRLITASQRYTKSRQILHIHQAQQTLPAPSCVLLPPSLTLTDPLNPKMAAKMERQQRWTRREEADFYRVVSTFGVVFDPDAARFDWTKFRAMARLHKKTDESLQKYLCAFTAMCRRVCRLPAQDSDFVDPSISIQPITEERASRTLYRIELLRKVREQVLRHPQLYDRLTLCQPGPDLPVWWEPGRHDRDLLIGAAKHGVSRTDYHILRDPELGFTAAQRNYSQQASGPGRASAALLVPQCHGPAAGNTPAGPPRNPDTQVEQDDAVHKEEPTSGDESDGKEQPEHWSPPSGPPTPTGLNDKARSVVVPPVANVKGFDEDSAASLSTTQDETQDSYLTENGLPSSNPFQGGYMLAASYWPKDRVMINRLDSICQVVLKGVWPTARRVYEGNMVSYTTKLLDRPSGPREDPSASPHRSKEGGLKLTFQKQGGPQKRPLEAEEGPLAQQQYLARLQELQSASEASLADFTNPQSVPPQGPTGQMRLNGALDGQPALKKRRGRRKNVEGVDSLLANKSRTPALSDHATQAWCGSAQTTPSVPSLLAYGHTQVPVDAESRVPVINLKDGTRLAGEDAPKRKDLEQWLKEHPGFVADVGAYIPGVSRMQFPDGRPKQKRHRCRNPNKIDVNSLTGEERVQIINRRNARKVGGAFAPPLKDLCRFLQENPEYGVPPEWADVVKQSGYLPESMFDRILTGPIVPEEVSRRGRRPKSMLAKAAAASGGTGAPPLGLNPLLTNGLLPGMDLSSLQALQQNLHSLQSLQLSTGLMGLQGDTSNLAAMFPMMLSGMAGLPNLLGVSGLLSKGQEGPAGTENGKKGSDGSDGGSKAPPLNTPQTSDSKGERTEGQTDDTPASSSTAPRSASTAAAAGTASGSPLAINSLLLSSVLYPGVLLAPGLNLPSTTASQPDQQPQSTQNKRSPSGDVSQEVGPAKGEESVSRRPAPIGAAPQLH